MSKYIPKVGEAFEWRNDCSDIWRKAGECIAHSEKVVGYESPNGWITSVNKECEFRPIQTKADVEREQLYGFFNDASNFGHSDEWLINRIQQSGFTIPKKVKRSDVRSLVHDWSDKPCRLVIEICELLGDLVEQDKGGAVMEAREQAKESEETAELKKRIAELEEEVQELTNQLIAMHKGELHD
jgi:hypothetical protein